MGVCPFALLPRVGILDAEDLRKLNYMPMFFVATAVSMGTALERPRGSISSPTWCSARSSRT
jgi:hypothetical protein